MVEGKSMVREEDSDFKKGLAYQRERFKAGKSGEGENNFDLMCDALECLKSDLRHKCEKIGAGAVIKRVQRIINWYRSLEEQYEVNTPGGVEVVFPKNLPKIINKNLTIGYELLMEVQERLDLL